MDIADKACYIALLVAQQRYVDFGGNEVAVFALKKLPEAVNFARV